MASRNKFYKNLNATATLKLLCNFLRGGERGIRTLGTRKYNILAGCPVQPTPASLHIFNLPLYLPFCNN